MTRKEFLNLNVGDMIFKGKRKAKVLSIHPAHSGAYREFVEFLFLDTGRKSYRGYKGLKLAKTEGKDA